MSSPSECLQSAFGESGLEYFFELLGVRVQSDPDSRSPKSTLLEYGGVQRHVMVAIYKGKRASISG